MMPEYLLDTDHLSYLQEGHPGVIKQLALLASEDRVFTSVVGVAELLRGVYCAPEIGHKNRPT